MKLNHLTNHYQMWDVGLCTHWRGKPWGSGYSSTPQGRVPGLPPVRGQELPPPTSPKDSAESGLKCFTSARASPGKTVGSNPIYSSYALLQVRFTPQEPCRCSLSSQVTTQCLPQLDKARCDKSKTNPRPPHFLNEISLFLGELVQPAVSKWFIKILTHRCSLFCLSSQ